MPQDAFTLRYLCKELDKLFTGGKINRIIEPSNDEVVFTVYTGGCTKKLLLDVNPACPRIAVIEREKESPLTAPNFCMLMRKHLLNATLLKISLIGFDRIVKIDFLSYGEFFDSVEKTLYVELMGRYSNVILTENGKILGGNRGINMFDDGVRPLIVGRDYVFPPVQDKKLPSDEKLIDIFDGVEINQLPEIICKSVQGVAQSTAKEIVEKYGNKTVNGKDFFNHLNNYLFSFVAKPCVIEENGEVKDVCVYPYSCVTGQIIGFESLYKAEEYYFEKKQKAKLFKGKKERLNSVTNTALKKAKKRLTAITAKEKDALNAEENRIKGELILSNIYRLKNGMEKCQLENYYDGTTVEIVLDSRLSPAQNAENFYKKYNKQKRTLTALKPQKDQAEAEIEYLTGVLDEIALAEDINELSLVQSELENQGLIVNKQTVKRGKKENLAYCRIYDVLGFIVRVGRNNTENDKVTFTAKGSDIWLHAKDCHSSHLIIECEGKAPPEQVINISAEICAYYSKGRDGGKTEIVYTQKKFVKKPPKSKPGFCTYTDFKSVTVQPKKHLDLLKSD